MFTDLSAFIDIFWNCVNGFIKIKGSGFGDIARLLSEPKSFHKRGELIYLNVCPAQIS